MHQNHRVSFLEDKDALFQASLCDLTGVFSQLCAIPTQQRAENEHNSQYNARFVIKIHIHCRRFFDLHKTGNDPFDNAADYRTAGGNAYQPSYRLAKSTVCAFIEILTTSYP